MREEDRLDSPRQETPDEKAIRKNREAWVFDSDKWNLFRSTEVPGCRRKMEPEDTWERGYSASSRV
jgi:hypothetical protein